jgi:hypothetical protein
LTLLLILIGRFLSLVNILAKSKFTGPVAAMPWPDILFQFLIFIFNKHLSSFLLHFFYRNAVIQVISILSSKVWDGKNLYDYLL